MLHGSTAHDASEDALSVFELHDAVFQELSLALRTRRLRGKRFHLGIRQATDGGRAEDPVQVTDHMAFDDLCGHVRDKSLLGNLDGVSEVMDRFAQASLPCRLQRDSREPLHS